jgi:ATP-dependent helicase/nuclease subunit B
LSRTADILAAPGPRWLTVPAHRPFLTDLAAGLLDALRPQGPEALANAVVLVPTRRAARALAEAFVEAGGGKALLLPQIRALGDLDEGEPPFEPGSIALDLPAAVSPLRRRFELARLVLTHGKFERSPSAPEALALADALAGFLDSLEIEEKLDPVKVETLVEGDLAEHWRRSADFLAIATRRWPERLEELGLEDPTRRRVQLLRRLADQWSARPPRHLVVAAGSTGSGPATADLLGVIADLPQGAVVLPGLDQDLPDAVWAAIEEGHPQDVLRRLLARHRVPRDQLREWPHQESTADFLRGRSRRTLVNEALRPADTTDDWLSVIKDLEEEGEKHGVDTIAEGMEGLSLVAARSEEEAAAACALLLRETLETPGATCALVTPDVALARRVSARLRRWGVEADASQGQALAGCPIGALLVSLSSLAADPCHPVRMLAVLKSPLARLSDEVWKFRPALERWGLRGPRADWAGYRQRLDEAAEPRDDGQPQPDWKLDQIQGGGALLDWLKAVTAPAPDAFAPDASAAEAARGLAEAVEALAGRGAWAGPAGESAAALIAGLMDEGEPLGRLTPQAFAALVETLVSEAVVRASGAHPRLLILGALEARLVRADRLVLAGLEEGVWPQGAPLDPFLSRPMRKRLGLPSPERRLGLSAHDFVQAACAPEVVLVSSERRGGAPAVQSRWLWRLQTLVRGAGKTLPHRSDILDITRALDAADPAPPESLRPAPRPEPTPPVELRPRKLAVTAVETWVRDPYALYARRILNLEPMRPPDERAEARTRGVAIHAAFEDFARRWDPARSDDEAALAFAGVYLDNLRLAGMPEAGLAREQTLARRAGHWAATIERERRASGPDVQVEQKGEVVLTGFPAGDFTLRARADRIERCNGQGHVLDFKTGSAPTPKMVATGFSPQLTLTAAILEMGGFGPPARPGELLYLRVTGRRPAGEVVSAVGKDDSAETLAAEALAGLQKLIWRYDRPEQGYPSRIAPQFVRQYAGDYDHLARVREWSASGEEEE